MNICLKERTLHAGFFCLFLVMLPYLLYRFH
jgi:hypothetical protein